MYSLIKCFSFSFLFVVILNPIQLNSQTEILTGIKPSLFTLRNSRVTVGFTFNSNITNENLVFFQSFDGELPESDSEFDFESIDYPYTSLGLSLDWFSPNSRIGLSISGEYNSSKFGIINDAEKFTFESNSLLFPLYLRYKFGNIHGKESASGRENIFLSFGPYITLPINFSRAIDSSKEKLDDVQQLGYGMSLIFGAIVRLSKEESKARAEDEKAKAISEGRDPLNRFSESPRFWIFVRADHNLTELFDDDYSDQIITNSSNPFEYKVTNVTFGIAYFFGGKFSSLD